MKRDYVIHSASERGYWNNQDGWVFSPRSATLFGSARLSMPCIGVEDAQLVEFSDKLPDYWLLEEA